MVSNGGGNLSSKKKINFINGTGERPNKDDPGYGTWKCDDDAVRNWLLNSLEPVQLGNFVRLPTSKDIWDAIKVSSFDGSDNTQFCNLQLRVWSLKQAGGSLEDYYNNLQAFWREVDFRTLNNMKCKEDADEFNKITQRDRLHMFLGGLDNRHDSIRKEILRMRPLPVVEEAFLHVRREDVRKAVHGGDSHNSMAMLTVGNKTNVVSYNTTQSNFFGSGPSAGGVSMLGQIPTPELKQQVAGIHYSAPQGGVQLSIGTILRRLQRLLLG